jgi:hypothetical protein
MSEPFLPYKRIQQEQHLKELRESSPAEKAKILLKNSGFAAAIYRNRKEVSVQFGCAPSPQNLNHDDTEISD